MANFIAGNDYSLIDQHCSEWSANPRYTNHLSVVIPVYNRSKLLARTLAGLVHQDYPNELIQVVVADDGSSDDVLSVIRRFESRLDLAYVYQRDEGYRLSAVRNLGIRLARHDTILLLDADVIPIPGFISAMMAYAHVSDECVMLGLRNFVDASEICECDILDDPGILERIPRVQSQNPIFESYTDDGCTRDWRLDEYRSTNNLKDSIQPFRSLVGAAAAFPRWAWSKVGGFCEDFRHWGGEDAEFGFRLYREGLFFIPCANAVGLHQEPESTVPKIDRRAGMQITDHLLASKCPIYFRHEPSENHSVPLYSLVTAVDGETDMDVLRVAAEKMEIDGEVIAIDPSTSAAWRWRIGTQSPAQLVPAPTNLRQLAGTVTGPICCFDFRHQRPGTRWFSRLPCYEECCRLCDAFPQSVNHLIFARTGDLRRLFRHVDEDIKLNQNDLRQFFCNIGTQLA